MTPIVPRCDRISSYYLMSYDIMMLADVNTHRMSTGGDLFMVGLVVSRTH